MGCCAAAALLEGCWFEQTKSCTDELRAPLTGDVFDKDGNPVVPDRVTVVYSESVVQECKIEPPSQGAARFRCYEGDGRATLTAYYGSEHTSKQFEVREEQDGCHALPQEVDLQFQ